MVNQAYPVLNGVEPSWADIAVTATVSGGELIQMSDISAIKWARKVEAGKKKGTSGGRVMGRTVGEQTNETGFTLYRFGYRSLIRSLAKVAPSRGNQKLISLVYFDIMIQHSVPDDLEIYQTKIKGCRLMSDSDDMKEGTDADQIEIGLDPMEIVNILDGEEITLI
jgi:hypothetical protein